MQTKFSSAFKEAEEIVLRNLADFTTSFPYSHSEEGYYRQSDNVEWTTGFWTGVLWLCYENSNNEEFKKAAEIQVDSFYKRIVNKIDTNHHDMGFLYSPSCVASFKIENNELGYKAAILAADNLISRFQEKGEFIQAWGTLGEEGEYRLIIDCLLNLPLLFWATKVTGDIKYEDIALRHIKTAMKVIIRSDNSTYHTYYFDKVTGLPKKGVTRQGNRDNSVWARGQAWGIYGSAIAYRYTKDKAYLDIFNRLTTFFVDNLPLDLIPYWDFDFSTPSTEPRDSSASAIAICGMLEMSSLTQDVKLSTTATKLLTSLIDNCAASLQNKSNGILKHGTYARLSPYNNCNNRGVDEFNLWGDYYYMEALMRVLNPNWESFW